MKPVRILIKTLQLPLALILIILSLATLTNLSPIYDFEKGQPFSGPDIYNPYSCLDTTLGWTRANLHTHTHARKWINECELYPEDVRAYYQRLGYGLVAFSNHMEITDDPRDTTGQIRVYEHGYNFAKHHNLVFGARKENYFDLMLPVTVSQKQFKMDMLLRDADFIFFNHPDRTHFTGESDMALLSGYRLLEADCGTSEKDSFCYKWDCALSNGHYVPSAISDDLHKPRQTKKIARRCTFLNCAGTSYTQVKDCLLKGNFYSAHIPDFGDGDWDIKIEANHKLPAVRSIGLSGGSEAYMELSSPASVIQVIGQNGQILETLPEASAVSYSFKDSDSYIRFVARYSDGTVLMSNPFARWKSGATSSGTPYRDFDHPVNWIVTLIFNLTVLVVSLALMLLGICTFRRILRHRN